MRQFLRRTQRAQDGPGLAGLVVIGVPGDEGEIQVAQVVEDRAASGGTAHDRDAVLLRLPRVAFQPHVLVPPDDHRVPVPPQVEDQFPFPDVFREGGFQRQVREGVVPLRADDRQDRDHVRKRTAARGAAPR